MLIEFVKHSFLIGLQEPEFIAVHFDRFSRFVAPRNYFSLDYPRSIDRMS